MLADYNFAMDSETDSLDMKGDRADSDLTRTVCVQTCSTDALTLDAVSVWFDDENAYVPFLKDFDKTNRDCQCQVFNMGYEKGWIRDACITLGKEFVNEGDERMKHGIKSLNAPNCVAMMEDKNAGCFMIVITNGHKIRGSRQKKKGGGHYYPEHYARLCIKDSAKIMGGKASMEEVAKAVRKSHPEYWANVGEDVKEDTVYNDGWYFNRAEDPDRFDDFVHYSKLDAFSQAMVMKYLDESGQSKGMTASGNSFNQAVMLAEDTSVKFAKDNYKARFPELDPCVQLEYEDGLVGGLVYGETGRTVMENGTKIDYKSSYPGGYWDMLTPSGRMHRVFPEDELWDDVMRGTYCRFFKCSFDFKLINGRMPCISAGECEVDGVQVTRQIRLKMIKGHRRSMITPEPYIEAVSKHYDITDFKIEYCDYYVPYQGYFKPAIREFFIGKEVCEGVERDMYKGCLNGGMHGKNITKMQRQHRLFDSDGSDPDSGMWSKKAQVEELNGSGYGFYLGMWVLMGRRAQLLNDLDKIYTHGGKVYMTDTDSCVTDLDEQTLKEIFGDELISEETEKELSELKKKTKEARKKKEIDGWDAMTDDEKDAMISKVIGKFSVEKAGITEFRCWGLKRYACYKDGEVVSTAFAGMTKRGGWYMEDGEWKRTEDLQKDCLSRAPLTGELFKWKQLTLKRSAGRYGEPVSPCEKTAGMQDIWWHDDMTEIIKSVKAIQ